MPQHTREPPGAGDGGFLLVEQVISITLVAGVLLALLGVLGTGSAGVVNGRQRVVATSLGKQAIERLQGSAYTSVAMNLSSAGLATDPDVTGTPPVLYFEGEQLVGGASAPYLATQTVSGTTYTLRTFVTAVVPGTGVSYRRITVIISWLPSMTGPFHTERFSSFVYPLDYTSYPAGSARTEVAGASFMASGSLGDDLFDDLHVALPAARVTTTASTLRTAQATAAGLTGVVDVASGTVASLSCQGGTDRVECPVTSTDEMADNDVATTAGPASAASGVLVAAAEVVTPGGVALVLPAVTEGAAATVEAQGSTGFGDADQAPWGAGSAATTSGVRATFDDTASGGLRGALWRMDGGWAAASAVDHDTPSGGSLSATASLTAPGASLFEIDGVPGFAGAVTVGSFTATAVAAAGTTATNPSAGGSATTIRVWDDTLLPAPGYREQVVVPGVALDLTVVGTVIAGASTVTFTTRVVCQPLTTSTVGGTVRTDEIAELPSVLVVSVQAVVAGPRPSTTTVVLDYGRVTADAGWLVKT